MSHQSSPIDYASNQAYRQQQERRAAIARQAQNAEKNKSQQSFNMLGLISLVLVSIK